MLKNVQALRALAALLVVGAHVNLGFDNANASASGAIVLPSLDVFGQFGVDIFFVISGFIMVVTNWNNFGERGVGRIFLLRRIARIYPLYWIVLAPIVVLYLVAAHQFMRGFEGKADIVASIALLPQAGAPLIPVAWTLTFEMFFYLVFTGLLALRRRTLLPTLAVWGSLEVVAFFVFHDNHNPYLRHLGMPLAIEFVFGAYIGHLYRSRSMPYGAAIGVLGVLGSIAMWTASAQPNIIDDFRRSDLMRVVEFGIPAAGIVYGAVAIELRGVPVAPTWAVALGNASYALYLCNMPIAIALNRFALRLRARGVVESTLIEIAIFVVVLGVSVAVHRFIEKPITTRLQRHIGRPSGRNVAGRGAIE